MEQGVIGGNRQCLPVDLGGVLDPALGLDGRGVIAEVVRIGRMPARAWSEAASASSKSPSVLSMKLRLS